MIIAWINHGRTNTASHDSTRRWFEDHVGGGSMFSASPVLALQPPADPAGTPVQTHTRDSFARLINDHLALNPDLASLAWCQHSGQLPARVTHAPDARFVIFLTEPYLRTNARGGTYGDFRGKLIMDAADPMTPHFYDCAHCAKVEGNRIVAATPTIDGLQPSMLVYSVLPGYTDLSQYLPPAPEVIGDAPMPGGVTIKDVLLENLPASSCGRCGKVAHNSRTCEKPPKAHDRIGIEIEGRWLDLRAAKATAARLGMTGCGDGSVNCSNTSDAQPWEFQTVPSTVAKALQQLVEVYPDESDQSCGMHVHMSFENLMDVSLLCTPAFFTYFKTRWTAWGDKMNIYGKANNRGEFWKRLNGDNDYCRVNANTPNGNITRMDRYHQLNFSAWSEHKTIECRLLPMFRKSSLAVSAVKELVDIVEDFLADPEACGLVTPSEDVSLPVPALTPTTKEYFFGDNDGALLTSELTLDMPDVSTLAPAAGTIRTFRGTVLAGATLASILQANGISVREAA